jgi:hypothetical protein
MRALVRVARATREAGCQFVLIDATHDRRELRQLGRDHAQVIEQHHTGVLRARTEKQTGFEPHEGHRDVGSHGPFEHGAGVGVHARRNVECQHWTLRGVDGADHRHRLGSRRSGEADA